ncbi:hypothetical protein R0131_11005 [Clostridium sp. AL.422]|uniref:hypothetical protein n=1 Tax=Clostridium TaxID=1485 RepID=UPI00293DB73E|nr:MULTISPECIES: hypothetical protein [unclassified Clostridium]MDV4151369.1 hypothetical protein [Clostridium sp. AL.422]
MISRFMYSIKSVFYKLNKEDSDEKIDKMQELKCIICGSAIAKNDMHSYIRDEELNVYCSKKCYLQQLNSKYY